MFSLVWRLISVTRLDLMPVPMSVSIAATYALQLLIFNEVFRVLYRASVDANVVEYACEGGNRILLAPGNFFIVVR